MASSWGLVGWCVQVTQGIAEMLQRRQSASQGLPVCRAEAGDRIDEGPATSSLRRGDRALACCRGPQHCRARVVGVAASLDESSLDEGRDAQRDRLGGDGVSLSQLRHRSGTVADEVAQCRQGDETQAVATVGPVGGCREAETELLGDRTDALHQGIRKRPRHKRKFTYVKFLEQGTRLLSTALRTTAGEGRRCSDVHVALGSTEEPVPTVTGMLPT
jgi:hypothetical protein